MNRATDRRLTHDQTRVLRLATFCCAIVASVAVWPGPGTAQVLTRAEPQTIAGDAYIYRFPVVQNDKTMSATSINQNDEQV